MVKDYLGKDQRKTTDEPTDDKPIQGKGLGNLFFRFVMTLSNSLRLDQILIFSC